MIRVFSLAKKIVIQPTTRVIALNVIFWSTYVENAWNSLRLDEQLIYLWFAVQTIAILTLFELILLK